MSRVHGFQGKLLAIRCVRCRMLEELCICDRIREAAALLRGRVTTRVLLVTHGHEQGRTSHTGHLLPLLLGTAEQRWWGRRHVTPDLEHLRAPRASAVLLFPDPGAGRLSPGMGGGAGTGSEALLPGPLTLVVPDGTWRQARRLAHGHPVLAALPRVTLPEAGPALWTVRRSTRPGGLCTLEAVARALGVLHGREVCAALEQVLLAHDATIWAARGSAPRSALDRPMDRPPVRPVDKAMNGAMDTKRGDAANAGSAEGDVLP